MLSSQLQTKPGQPQPDRTPPMAEAPTHVALAERRNAMRVPVIKSAKIVTAGDGGQSTYNCLVLDESAAGVLVDLGAMFSLPEEMTLHMTGGASYRARRCWAVGTKAGLSFIGPQMLSAEAVEKLGQLGRMMQSQGLPATMAALRGQHFFESEELRRAAEAAEAAYQRLESVLIG
ncbi:MAG TPA: hypothetical protein VEQ16_01645 [Acidocella sp.]|jgi:hypothetical protein|nr:hypothetical protein [Acidocella sp.]